jgi:hypothetical protein
MGDAEEHRYRRMSYPLIVIGCILLVIAFLVGISDNPPGIVSMLVGFFAVVVGVVFLLVKPGRRTPAQQLLYWAPRALCMVFALFISLFALDVFNEGNGFWGTTLALLVHLIPTFLIIVLLAVSWRWEWIGGILFPLLGLLYVVWARNKPFGVLSTLLLIAGPLVLTGGLFLLNWHYRNELRG